MAQDHLPRQPTPSALLSDIRHMIQETRSAVAVAVNAGLTILYSRIGKRIAQEILKGKRAEYGKEIVPTVSAQLVPEFGTGFGVRNLFRMIKFAEVFPDEKTVSTLSAQLSWSHFVEIIPLKDELQRDFYAEMCRVE
jgi:hypothetical protein